MNIIFCVGARRVLASDKRVCNGSVWVEEAVDDEIVAQPEEYSSHALDDGL